MHSAMEPLVSGLPQVPEDVCAGFCQVLSEFTARRVDRCLGAGNCEPSREQPRATQNLSTTFPIGEGEQLLGS
eukprot:s323_g17.t2